MLEAFFALVNCIINKKKRNRIEYKKNREASVCLFVCLFLRKQAVSK